MAEQRVRGLSLRRKVTGWLGAILAVTLVSIGMATAVGRWTSTAFDAMLADNSACYTVQDALAAETKAFSRMVREPSRENTEEYQTACEITEASLAELPFDYEKIGEERYARTWNLLQGYAGYQKYRDAFLQMVPAADTYVDQMYRVMELQDYLSEYALRLTQATLEQENAVYSAQADQLEQLPWVYLGLFLMALALMLVLLDMLSRAVVRPLLALARASRSIADNDFSGQDLPVHSQDEVGRLTGTFNQMKHAMQEHLATLNALHREEVRNLALEKDLDHTRMEMLKSQVNPHFLFNTLNMISCMARLEDAETTDKMIVSLGNLFRHNLRTKQQEVTLEEELDGLEDYIYLPRAESLRGGRAHPAAGLAAGENAVRYRGRQRQRNDGRGACRSERKNAAERTDRKEHRTGKYLPTGVHALPGYRKNAGVQPGGAWHRHPV